ncbi:MAG: DNA damage-inducible protein D [Planctomycetes bacterium]|nr:DNA damage-inducible protein D [Planctomycetota bacterium]
MNRDLITRLFRSFEALAHREGEVEYWLARELQPLFGYERWENFATLLERARTACEKAGQAADDHFREVTKMVSLGSGARRELADVALTRYAAYLIAQNGDPHKEEIAFAQTYFAVQTRKQELIEARLEEIERLEARKGLAASEKELSGVIFERLREHESFARIRSKGDAALFGGRTTRDMKKRLRVPKSRPLADFLPTITIKAKDLANEMTAHNVKTRDLGSESTITSEHVGSNREVRAALSKRGIKPEQLPPAEDVRKLERRVEADSRKLPARAPRLRKGKHKRDDKRPT